jgi:acyl carrier protein
MSHDQAIEAEVRQFLADNFPLSAEGLSLAGSDSLLETGVIDSVGVLELIEFVESRYEIEIPDSEVLPENLDSIDAITRYVSSKRDAAGDPAADVGS